MQYDIPKPQPEPNPQSEVARLRAQISEEYEAARQGLFGLAMGSSQHRTITGKLRLGELYNELVSRLGDEAKPLIISQLANPADYQYLERPQE